LFATLDPTVRRLDGLGCGPVVLSDTVGFVRDLPHDLVAAFRSTLSEARDADLLLHVVDASDELRDERIEQVDLVLKEIGADEIPQLFVFNKIDCIVSETAEGEARAMSPRLDRIDRGERERVWLSARDGAGMDLLREALSGRFQRERIHRWIQLPSRSGRLRARLFEAGAVLTENVEESGWTLELDLPRMLAEQLCATPEAEAVELRHQLLAAT
jgi:GTP-binding protein HflX